MLNTAAEYTLAGGHDRAKKQHLCLRQTRTENSGAKAAITGMISSGRENMGDLLIIDDLWVGSSMIRNSLFFCYPKMAKVQYDTPGMLCDEHGKTQPHDYYCEPVPLVNSPG